MDIAQLDLGAGASRKLTTDPDSNPSVRTSEHSRSDIAEFRQNPPRLLNLRELCVLLDISERHARHLIAERKLPAIRLGYRLLFDTAKIFAALERLTG